MTRIECKLMTYMEYKFKTLTESKYMMQTDFTHGSDRIQECKLMTQD